jgi:molecular chaperone GrpE (heat shock protein)
VKITFEGSTYQQIVDEMRWALDAFERAHAARTNKNPVDNSNGKITEPENVQGSSPEPEPEADMGKPEQKLKKSPTASKPKTKAPAPKAALEEPADEPDPFDDTPPSPAEMVAIRQKTIDELQAAYANGKQKAVFDLLSKHGNGAKSFRELTVEAFIPIRKAIDQGALA